jgi:hypothetical protein
MITKTIDREVIECALNDAGLDWSDLGDTYSGRGMYGERCLSFIVEGKRVQRDLCRFFIWLTNNLLEDGDDMDAATDLADAVSTDDLGLDMIVYFPGWTLA